MGGLRVSDAHDAAEQEAARVARLVVSLPPSPVSATGARFAGLVPGPAAQRATAADAPAPRSLPARASAPGLPSAGGEPLSPALLDFLEPRFGADFSSVRVHTGADAARASRELNAAAFTVGNRIFFGGGAFRPDTAEGRELLAHELAHTIQQGAVPQAAQAGAGGAGAPALQRAEPAVHRLGIGDAWEYFASHADAVPGFRLLTLVLGRNPVTGSPVDATPGNLLRAAVEVMPGGVLITRALDNHGVTDRAAAWVRAQVDGLGLVASSIRRAIGSFLSGLRWSDVFDLGGVWERAKLLVSEPARQVRAFLRGLVSGVLQLIRDAILRPLDGLARRLPGWDVLCAVLGRNPITGDPVPRNAETVLGGFLRLIGREDVWRNIQRANAVERTYAWFQGVVAGLRGGVAALPGLFLDALRSLTLADLLTLPLAFARVGRVFGGFAGRFAAWAREQVLKLLEIVFSVVAPGVVPYVRRVAGGLRTILTDPVGFVSNLVRAGAQGLRQFGANAAAHLRAGLLGWLAGALAGTGVYVPRALSAPELLRFVLSALGVTWQTVRAKLVRAVGEGALAALERGFDVVATLVREGPAAAWQRLQEGLGDLRELVLAQVVAFVRSNVVAAAIARLVATLSPAGAFVQAIVAIYRTVTVFVDRLREIARVGASFVSSLATVAAGAVAAVASRVEQALAGLLSTTLGFLARLLGLGRLGSAIVAVVTRFRQAVDRALDRLVAWIVALARRLGRLGPPAGTTATSPVSQERRT